MKLGLGAVLSAAMAAAVVIATLSGPARAAEERPLARGEEARAAGHSDARHGGGRQGGPGNGGGRHAVPEFDPAAAGAVAALLAGGALTIASRRRRSR